MKKHLIAAAFAAFIILLIFGISLLVAATISIACIFIATAFGILIATLVEVIWN